MRLIETRNYQGIASSQRTRFYYDRLDRIVDTMALTPAGGVMNRITVHYYDVFDSAGNSRIVTVQHGNDYAWAPSIRTFVQFDRFGRMTQEGTEGGRIMTYTHDIIGRVVREQSLGIDNTFTYNIHGVTAVRNILGHTARNEYDHMGRLTRSFCFRGYDQRFTYDALGRVTRHYKPMFALGNGEAYHTITTHQYDRNGNLTRTATLTNRQFHTREWAETINRFEYNRLVYTRIGGTGEHGVTTTFAYSPAGDLIRQTVGGATTQFAYDHRGRLERTTDPGGRVETYTYDQNGNLLTRTDRNGSVFRYYYDHMGRVNFVLTLRNGVEVNRKMYSYHTTGSLRFQSQDHDIMIYYYDAQGRVVRESNFNGWVIHTYTYNAANNVTHFSTRTMDGQANWSYHVWEFIDYDVAQRPYRIVTFDGWGGILVTYAYDANGNRIRATLRNGIVTEYTFSPGNFATRVVNRQGSTVLSQFDYIYLLDGNIHQVAEQFQETARNRTIVYTYDTARRLTNEVTTGHGAGTRAFTFDIRGNRAAMTVTGRENYTVTYTYTICNRLLTETRIGSNHRINTFTYDNNGNQLTRTAETRAGNVTIPGYTETRTYNALNQLVRVVRPGMNAEYTYQSDGLRLRRVVNGWWTYQIWNRGQLSLELNINLHAINRFYNALAVNHRIRSLHHGFYLYNARGDVMQRTDNYGNVIYTYQYDSFGTELPPAGNISTTSNNPFRFGGEYYDWERGEYYLRARSFSPRLGRFTQPDPFWNIHNMQSSPAAIMQSANLFVFVMNNPVRWLDPSGMSIMCFKTNSMDGGGIIPGGSFGKNTGASARGAQPTGGGNNVGNVGLGVGMGAAAAEVGREIWDGTRNVANSISNAVRNYSQSRAQERPAILAVQFIDAVTGNVSAPVPWSPDFAVALPAPDVFSQAGAAVADAAEYGIVGARALTLDEVAGRHGNLQCKEAAQDMARWLQRRNQDFMFAEIWFQSQGFIVSDIHIGRGFISETGWHVGVLHNGVIRCNIHPQGLPTRQWFADFHGVGPRFTSISPVIRGPGGHPPWPSR